MCLRPNKASFEFRSNSDEKICYEPAKISEMKKLVILGSGGYAKEILSAVDDINSRELAFDFLGFVDPGSHNESKPL